MIKFRMLAYTDAAGKKSADALQDGNEDNFYVDDDLGDNIPRHFVADKVIELSSLGMLMVVADGMGGMNAGEVASGIAMDTVAEYFAPNVVPIKTAMSHDLRKKYLEMVVAEADRRIKNDAKIHEEHLGMGSTIVMAWIVGQEMTLCWCGDSRAYRFNPQSGIELLSKDHSYVQELVDRKYISYDDAFCHPDNNLVTRSLGATNKPASPDIRLIKLNQSDIILLCSDGLNGVLRDKKTYDREGTLIDGENIEDIIRDNSSSLVDCRKALWTAAEKAGWYDNVTVAMCEILETDEFVGYKSTNKKTYIAITALLFVLVFSIWQLSQPHYKWEIPKYRCFIHYRQSAATIWDSLQNQHEYIPKFKIQDNICEAAINDI